MLYRKACGRGNHDTLKILILWTSVRNSMLLLTGYCNVIAMLKGHEAMAGSQLDCMFAKAQSSLRATETPLQPLQGL